MKKDPIFSSVLTNKKYLCDNGYTFSKLTTQTSIYLSTKTMHTLPCDHVMLTKVNDKNKKGAISFDSQYSNKSLSAYKVIQSFRTVPPFTDITLLMYVTSRQKLS